LLDEFLIEVHAIRQDHVSNGSAVLFLAECLEHYVLIKDQLGGGLLCSLPIGLAFLWAVDAVEPNTSRPLVVQDFEGVTVEDADGGVVTWP
jgi:hypothetical protein